MIGFCWCEQLPTWSFCSTSLSSTKCQSTQTVLFMPPSIITCTACWLTKENVFHQENTGESKCWFIGWSAGNRGCQSEFVAGENCLVQKETCPNLLNLDSNSSGNRFPQCCLHAPPKGTAQVSLPFSREHSTFPGARSSLTSQNSNWEDKSTGPS